MKISQRARTFLIFFLILFNLGCDQLSKYIIRKNVAPYADHNFLGGHFVLTRVENTGAFLSLGDSIPVFMRIILLSVLPALALILGIGYLVRRKEIFLLNLVGISLIIGGGIGNVFDRIIHGSVTDFLYMDFWIFHTGVFNLGDVSISTGVILILLSLFVNRDKNHPVTTTEEPV